MFRQKYQNVCEDVYDEIGSKSDENEEKGMTKAEAIKTTIQKIIFQYNQKDSLLIYVKDP